MDLGGHSNLGHGPGDSGNAQWWTKASTDKNCNLNIHPDPSSGESTFTMAASSIMVSHDGVRNVPAYRGSTYGLAVNSGGAGADSVEATATPIAVPTGLMATAGNGQISLAWNAAPGATGYKIYVGTTSGGPYPTMSTTGTDSATVSGLTNGTTYTIIVTGTNAHGESNASAQISATPTSSGSGTTNPPTQNPQDPAVPKPADKS